MSPKRTVVTTLAAVALLGVGCGRHPAPPPPGGPHGHGEPNNAPIASNNISANSMFGSIDIHQIAAQCAGRVKLTQGSAAVNDTCFSGDTNVVLCTDATAANAVQCSPAAGKLTVAGTSEDVISYARLR